MKLHENYIRSVVEEFEANERFAPEYHVFTLCAKELESSIEGRMFCKQTF